ncbi:SAM-dependent methyltransferase [Pontibacillus halophilus JSM 076056 = DSM 19796]|uniref:SAM-dependent methyltransferase n=1 Tax=Pontibacillus halophilus JSM 076056 = DSM 19796 TaxID=1385510 RepID=A0A0A5GQT7_9BACI|nr:tRNA (adenine(22)-N(1))-methyltransferase TrmK [Pontibacillus halophilus]KGX93598.1 SAM-dependent methyltransferase [Pontibacillus halophilus JSM 076056 = DSM 19796]
MNSLQLSKRLKTVASYVEQGGVIADIGSDHAYLPCYICLQDETATAIAGEVNQGPYEAAKGEVERQELTARIQVRKGDGLQVLDPNEATHITIAGMGGTLISSILENGKSSLAGVKRIITQPNVDAEDVRRWFRKEGYALIDETILEEDGRIYEVLVAEPGNPFAAYSEQEQEQEKELWFGPYLLKKRQPAFLKKWQLEKGKLNRVVGQMKQAQQPDEYKILQFNERIKWIEEVMHNG